MSIDCRNVLSGFISSFLFINMTREVKNRRRWRRKEDEAEKEVEGEGKAEKGHGGRRCR